ncbi:unnamed protein product [Peronospora farinosa]|uniref:Uncharacterized protein n=1 Tax=Peronospora farinosa TaxID=134698 RepID=A0AAV0SQS5_9STRA|nr:unnamed protein product [Peronospora farinosa]CAI5705972.1 unnamed protein product [Peronospora farinosa]
MAARVTKLFLQNCASASDRSSKHPSNKHLSTKSKTLESSFTLSKHARRKFRQKSKKVCSKSKVKVLEEARRELQQADRTAQNLRKLKSKVPTKSQRLMAKVLAQRTAAFR